ncbi:MAG: type II toxin-antitoxin system MqsA family antitoxin [Leptospirillum sp.]
MKCHVCGGNMELQLTDMPFKLSARTIAILKDLPVLQCDQCAEYVIEDPIMERVDALLEKVDQAAVLEIVQFAT